MIKFPGEGGPDVVVPSALAYHGREVAGTFVRMLRGLRPYEGVGGEACRMRQSCGDPRIMAQGSRE